MIENRHGRKRDEAIENRHGLKNRLKIDIRENGQEDHYEPPYLGLVHSESRTAKICSY